MNKKHDHTHVLTVGDALFRERGYHNTGTEEILEQAAFPRSSFYYHFKSKEGFGVKTLEFYGGNIRSMLEGILTNAEVESPTERLKQYFYMICSYNENKEYNNCCLVQRFSIDASDKPGVLQQTAYDQFQQWVDVAAACIEEGQQKGELRADVSVRDLAEFLFSMIFGSNTVGRLSREPKEMQEKMELAFKLIRA